jgi:hypothetical protein
MAPFRFQGGDDVDGFPTVDGAERPVVRWGIQFKFDGGKWEDLGRGHLYWDTQEGAQSCIDAVHRSWWEEGGLEMRVVACVEIP